MADLIRDEFLSEEDLNLHNLSDEELYAWWNEWLRLAQATNEYDKDTYSHGVFMLMEEPHGKNDNPDNVRET